MAQTVIGLDIGSWSIKAAVLEMSLRRFTLLDFREHHIPRDPNGHPMEEDLTVAVGAALHGLKERGAIVTAVPGSKVLSREVELPFSDDKRIRSVLAFQLDGQLPVPLEDLVYDYINLGKTESGGARLLCSGVDRAWLGRFLGDLKAIGADPKIVNLDTVSLVQLVPHLGLAPPPPPVTLEGVEEGPPVEPALALVDIGHTSTSVTVVRGTAIEAVRTVPVGGHQLTLALMRGLGLDYGQAEHCKHTRVRLDGGVPPGVSEAEHARMLELLSNPLARIVREVRTTLHAHAHRSGQAVRQVVLFGGSTRMPGMVERLGEALELPVVAPDLTGREWSKVAADRGIDEVLPKSASLALSFIGDTRGKQLNFRQGDLAFESDFKAFRERAAWLLLLVVVCLGVYIGRQVIRLGQLEDNSEKLAAELESFSESVLGQKSRDFDGVLAMVSKPPEVETETIFPEMTAFRAFYEISAAQETVNSMRGEGVKSADAGGEGGERPPGPRDEAPPGEGGEGGEGEAEKAEDGTYKLEFSDMTVDLKSALIKGETNSLEALEEFRSILLKNHCFRSIDVTDTNRIRFQNRSGWLRFTLKLGIQCSEPEADKTKKKGAAK